MPARKPPPKRKPDNVVKLQPPTAKPAARPAKPAPAPPPKAALKRAAIPPAKIRHQPYLPSNENRKMVEAMVACGVPQVDIAGVLGITRSTLLRHFRSEIDISSAKAVAKVAAALYNRALAGDVPAMKFFLLNRASGQWVERVTVVDGGTEQDPRTMTDQQIDERLTKLRRTRAVKRPNAVH